MSRSPDSQALWAVACHSGVRLVWRVRHASEQEAINDAAVGKARSLHSTAPRTFMAAPIMTLTYHMLFRVETPPCAREAPVLAVRLRRLGARTHRERGVPRGVWRTGDASVR